jgi:hypothetical protein
VLSSSGGAPFDTHFDASSADRALGVEADVLAHDLRALLGDVRAARRRALDTLATALRSHPPPARVAVLRHLAHELPHLLDDLGPDHLAATLDLPEADLAPLARDSDPALALGVLRELAAWYHTPQPLVGADAIVGFGQKIQDALDALFAAYVPLRNGMKTFESEFDVAQNPTAPRGPSSVAHAQSAEDVGARALDWSDPRDAAHAFRSLFADVMIHNLSLLRGVMTGAAALARQLSPAAIAATFEDDRRAGRTGLALGLFRYRELWRALERRHDELTRAENETFKHLFGREFADSYEQFFSAAIAASPVPPARAPGQGRASSAPPRGVSSPAPATGPTGTLIPPPRR